MFADMDKLGVCASKGKLLHDSCSERHAPMRARQDKRSVINVRAVLLAAATDVPNLWLHPNSMLLLYHSLRNHQYTSHVLHLIAHIFAKPILHTAGSRQHDIRGSSMG